MKLSHDLFMMPQSDGMIVSMNEKKHEKIISDPEKMSSFEIEDQTISSYPKFQIDHAGAEKSIYNEIRKMKNLAASPAKNPWQRVQSTPALFVLQGNYIKDWEDQFNRIVSYNSYKPSYADMHNDQIRCYITWRTNLRKDEVYKISLSYVVLYIFEIINNIGVTNPEDGFGKLALLWNKYREQDIRIDRYLLRWLKDYYLCNEFSDAFSTLVEKYGLQKFYPETSMTYENGYLSPADLRKVSNYKVDESNLWKGRALLLFDSCLSSVMKDLELLLDLYGLRLSDILACKISGENFWSPFDNAVYLDIPPSDKKVYINPVEFYECVDGVWSFYHPREQNDATSAFVGYIVKRIAARLKILKNGEGELPNRLFLQTLLQRVGDPDIAAGVNAAISDPTFDEIIDASAAECFHCFDIHTGTITGSMPVPAILRVMEMAESELYCRFREVRRLALIDAGEKDKRLQFFEQAKALAAIEDDFRMQENPDLHADVSNQDTTVSGLSLNKAKAVLYTHMNNSQLRSYFSWRTAFRAGKNPELCERWILQYMCELIHGIGTESGFDVISKLRDVLLCYGNSVKRLEKLAVSAIRDYYLCHEFECPFIELVQMMELEQYFPYICIAEKQYEKAFQIFSGISGYKIQKSRFYSDKKAPLIEKCFSYVVSQTALYFEKQELDFYQVILGNPEKIYSMQAFKDFDFYYAETLPQKAVELCSGELYEYTSVGWTCDCTYQGNPAAPGIVGYIIKRMEATMRNICKYKNKLSPDIFSTVYSMPDGSVSMKKVEDAMLDPQFDRIIDQAVQYFFETEYPGILQNRELNFVSDSGEIFHTPVVVQIDEALLDDIREKADENLEKLLISEIEGENDAVAHLSEEVPEEKITTENVSDEWEEFFAALSDPARQALVIIAENNQTAKQQLFALSAQCNIMVEVLIEMINEQAIVYIGDMLIENNGENIIIYDDYSDDVKTMLKEQLEDSQA